MLSGEITKKFGEEGLPGHSRMVLAIVREPSAHGKGNSSAITANILKEIGLPLN